MTQPPTGGRPPAVFDMAFLTDQSDATIVTLVRHGEQTVPDAARATPADFIDPPLSERGEAQARLVGERFATEPVDIVYASPLKRAFRTGQEIAKHHGLEPVVLDDLKEVQIFHEIPADQTAMQTVGEQALRGIRNRMMREKSWDVYPYSEPSRVFHKRIVNAIEGIIATHEGARIVIACHGGVINAYIGHIIGSPYDMFFRPAHTSVNVVAARDWVRALHVLNDTHHLTHPHEGEYPLLSH
jgi:broad specificity phosphatase PhoE